MEDKLRKVIAQLVREELSLVEKKKKKEEPIDLDLDIDTPTGDENIKYKCMQNGFFGCCKNNKILKECISTIIKNYKEKNYGINPWFPTGPCLLGESFRKVNPEPNNINTIKLGHTVTDKDDGPCFIIDSKKMIINKCCLDINVPSTVFENGNNYIELWNSKQIYK
jgi:hypothetical protein